MRLSCGQNRLIGRSGEAQTRGLRIPNAARYQLRYTPIVIKLWSCKWSNLWSSTFLTAFYHFPNRPKSARLKGFRRFSLLHGANTVYVPKSSALPTAPHPVIFIFSLFPAYSLSAIRPRRFPQKHSRGSSLGSLAPLLVSSPRSNAFIRLRRRHFSSSSFA